MIDEQVPVALSALAKLEGMLDASVAEALAGLMESHRRFEASFAGLGRSRQSITGIVNDCSPVPVAREQHATLDWAAD